MINAIYKLDAHLVVLVFYGENRFHMHVQYVIYKIIDYLELTLIQMMANCLF